MIRTISPKKGATRSHTRLVAYLRTPDGREDAIALARISHETQPKVVVTYILPPQTDEAGAKEIAKLLQQLNAATQRAMASITQNHA